MVVIHDYDFPYANLSLIGNERGQIMPWYL